MGQSLGAGTLLLCAVLVYAVSDSSFVVRVSISAACVLLGAVWAIQAQRARIEFGNELLIVHGSLVAFRIRRESIRFLLPDGALPLLVWQTRIGVPWLTVLTPLWVGERAVFFPHAERTRADEFLRRLAQWIR